MKWLKCDLQMQTPGDQYNWLRTCNAYIGGNPTDEQVNQSVDLYLKRCHEVGLQVIGITDHNFIGKSYLKRLIERNSEVARSLGKDPLVIFPGFEVEISQGLGVHLLCLFECDTPLDVIDEMVTQLGLPSRSRVNNNAIVPLPPEQNFNSVVSFIQEHKDYPGVVIAAHPLAESGMLNNNFMSQHFQTEMFTDPRLLAMEIPKEVGRLARGIQKIILATEDCHIPWKRQRPIATVMSSDCYSLEESDKGFIGKRYSWIQFSKPSIDSLRQAFIDHSSRIKLQEFTPDNEFRFGKIKSLEIKDVAFLEDQTIHFSPNLNCIIGGRGSGKSSILEYIRLCTNTTTKFSEQMIRVKNTLQPHSVLRLTWKNQNGLTDVFEFKGDQISIPTREEVRDIEVILKGLGISIYSQREITQMGQDSPSLIPMVDQISGQNLKEEMRKEELAAEKLVALIQDEIKLERLKQERTELEQELDELKRQWDAFTFVKEFSERKNKVNLSRNAISAVRDGKDEVLQSLNQTVATVGGFLEQYENMALPSQGLIESDYLNYIKDQFVQALQTLKEEIEVSGQKMNKSVFDAMDNHLSWNALIAEFDKSEKEFEEACKAQGITQEEFEVLQDTEEKMQIKEQQIEHKETEILKILDRTKEVGDLQDELHNTWKRQHEIRQTKVDELTSLDTIPKVRVDGVDTPFLKIDIIYMGDLQHFLDLWDEFPYDGRQRLGRNWTSLGEAIFKEFSENSTYSSPWCVLEQWLDNQTSFPSELASLYNDIVKHFIDNFEQWRKLKTRRVHDAVNITLYRTDGTRAGSLLDNGLSDGQKNTAILTLLFAQGNGPIIIDQPEDELDSNFIYNELVPIIRTMKSKRQIIIVSHNANLPVNGDAQLVYALKTDVGRGKLRTEGGLDNPHVKQAILDIMEGSAEAFARRSEKYSS